MEACAAADTWTWLKSSLGTVNTAASILLTSTTASAAARRSAGARLGEMAMPVATVLGRAGMPAHMYQAHAAVRSAEGQALVMEATAALWQPDLLRPAASALRSYLELARVVERVGDAGPSALNHLPHSCAVLASTISSHLNSGLVLLDRMFRNSPSSMSGPSTGTGASPPTAEPLAAATKLLGALAESELLPALAGAALRYPGPDPDRVSSGDEAAVERAVNMCATADNLLSALVSAHQVSRRAVTGGGEAAAQAARLAAQLSHPDVVALQEALVGRLLLHGGVELGQGPTVPPGPGPAVGGQGGTWWLTAMEAKLGRTITADGTALSAPGDQEALEVVHSQTLALLLYLRQKLAAREPRALEALCRLGRGRGLGGAYVRPASQVYASNLNALMERTKRAESAAWALAVYTQAVEQQLTGAVTAEPHTGCSAESAPQLHGLAGACNALCRMACKSGCTPDQLGASSLGELEAQLTRADLPGSLDHALRLSFAAADRAALNPGHAQLQRLASERDLPDGGVLVTFAKRAAMLASRLQELEGTAETLSAECRLLAQVTHQILPALGRCRPFMYRLGAEGGIEVRALLARANSHLNTQLLARAALRRVGAQSSGVLYQAAVIAVEFSCLEGRWSSGQALSTGQLLACQPHRLLAAACKLLCADIAAPSVEAPAPGTLELRAQLAGMVEHALVALAASPDMSNSVQAWLAPPAEAGAGSSGGTSGGGGGGMEQAAAAAAAERGCLEPLLRLGVLPRAADLSLEFGSSTGPLLRSASRDTAAGFQACARSLAGSLFGAGSYVVRMGRGNAVTAEAVISPGMDLEGLLAEDEASGRWSQQGGGTPGTDVAALVAAPLPPPVPVPLAAAALPGFKVCANPRCLSYGGRSEADVAELLCGGCKCVRYCGPVCQKAHWKAGHRQDCRAASSAARAAAQQAAPSAGVLPA
ncbi:hypothetical protein HYH03_003843 [Edaphochlamys debaryana]|uniref:MYND-type domain-containing protein n=1 Tax=Edaphochlamys debaryana TaxID=47281 RepID=A0A836C2S8_9CHLO|nr:hypothetical protein HYH03_003843 [Edaphochlamys debaryana]|eukprot:KAG2498085.1 hypothetical protein HYH03_003843 [Edaphochlamys debaryana]